jgi:hypothetical protein
VLTGANLANRDLIIRLGDGDSAPDRFAGSRIRSGARQHELYRRKQRRYGLTKGRFQPPPTAAEEQARRDEHQ